jgi:hypothetical protein
MPVQVYEDSLELHTAILEEDGYNNASWPYPMLKQSGKDEKRRFRAIILENEYLKLTFLPELGGRLWELLDKRFNHPYFSSDKVYQGNFSMYTPQGIGCLDGFRLIERGRERKGSLEKVDFLVEAPKSDEDDGSITFAAFGSQSFEVRYLLEPKAASVRVEVKVQNRIQTLSPYFFCGFDSCLEESAGIFPAGITSGMNPDHHIWFTSERGTFLEHYAVMWETFFLKHADRDAILGPRQADQYCFNILPTSYLKGESYVGEAGVAFLEQDNFSLCASHPLVNHRLLIQNDRGECFESPFNAYPEVVSTTNLSSIPGAVVAAKIVDESGNEVAVMTTEKWQVVPGFAAGEPAPRASYAAAFSPTPEADFRRAYPLTDVTKLEDHELNRLTSDFTLRVPAYLELAARATERGDYQRADTCYEHALLFNGDDPLAWWAKSVNRRIGNLDDENAERTELLNAHYLSPLEPCLRAEAFLAQPRNHGKDPSPLLASFNDVPENFIEVACQLIQARFYEEAAYFIDEALRHQNLGMLHYLHAHLLSRKGGMDMEVASRVQMALKAKFPPMPYRDLEREILTLISIGHELPQVLRDWLNGDFD